MPTFSIQEEDIPYEEDVIRNEFSVKAWLRYLQHKKEAAALTRFVLYERALKSLPGSYTLWYRYLLERVKAVAPLSPADPARKEVNHVFERALVFMHKMPRIWINFLEFVTAQQLITYTRHMFDAALRALPITQHHRIWPLYLKFLKMHNIPETTVRVFRRHLMLDPDAAEDYIDYLLSVGRVDDAAGVLVEVVNRDKYAPKSGKTAHQLWVELCQLIAKNPDKIASIKVEPIIRGGLRRFSNMVGVLWNALADFHIRQGNFERARDVYEEAIQTVPTVRDFSQVFDAYAEFEEQALNADMEGGETDDLTLEMRLARFERLMARRPLLLNSVLLRQNPHNVEEWLKRVALYKGNPAMMAQTYKEAVGAVDPKMAAGKLPGLWIAFARMYEDCGELGQAREVFEQAVLVPFKTVDDLASVWCEYVEMEVRNKQYKKALHRLQTATTVPPRSAAQAAMKDSELPVQMRVHKSLKLWSLYADLEESLGSFASAKAVYTRMLELRVATPQLVINFATFLEEANYFEDAFAAYERGIALFKWPTVYELWNVYLVKFIKRYGGSKLERTRELFEQVLGECGGGQFAKPLFLLYASFEEQHGLARHAMAVYERAAAAVLPEERFEMWQLYIARASSMFGVTHTRPLYEKAIASLGDSHARDMSVQFAELERKLGEIDRARSIYAHASQFSDPRTSKDFWRVWHEFEVRHGNEDTYRDMLRIKRSVAASYNASLNVSAAMTAVGVAPADTMAALEANVKEAAAAKKTAVQFVRSGGGGAAPAPANTDEIQLEHLRA